MTDGIVADDIKGKYHKLTVDDKQIVALSINPVLYHKSTRVKNVTILEFV